MIEDREPVKLFVVGSSREVTRLIDRCHLDGQSVWQCDTRAEARQSVAINVAQGIPAVIVDLASYDEDGDG